MITGVREPKKSIVLNGLYALSSLGEGSLTEGFNFLAVSLFFLAAGETSRRVFLPFLKSEVLGSVGKSGTLADLGLLLGTVSAG